jgi:MFS family permease
VTVWRHRRFRLFWTGDSISAAGGALSAVAVPLLAIETLHASDAAVGLVRAAQTLPFLLLAIPIGLLADRISRRHLLLAADAVRFPLVALIALLSAAPGVPLLVVLVFVVGIATVAYEVAYLSVLPDLVDDPTELPHANRAVETAHATASLLGPAAGGALVTALTPAGVIAIDALSFAAGATLTALNRWDRHPTRPAAPAPPAPTPTPASGLPAPPSDAPASGVSSASPGAPASGVSSASPGAPASGVSSASPGVPASGPPLPRSGEPASGPSSPPSGGRALLAGWTWLWSDRYVRPMTLYLAVNNVAAQAFQTALLLFVVRTLGLSAAALGLAVAAAGGGFLVGAMISPPLARRLGTGRVVIAASLIGALGIAVVAAAPPHAGYLAVLLGAALSGAGPGLLNLHSIALRQAITPPALLGRVNAVVKTISYGSATLGALAGGLAAAAAGPRAVIATAALVSALATAILAASAVRSLAATPARPA